MLFRSIPPYKYYAKLKKALNDEVILMSLVPPNCSSLKVYKNGGVLYHEEYKEAMNFLT